MACHSSKNARHALRRRAQGVPPTALDAYHSRFFRKIASATISPNVPGVRELTSRFDQFARRSEAFRRRERNGRFSAASFEAD